MQWAIRNRDTGTRATTGNYLFLYPIKRIFRLLFNLTAIQSINKY